MRAAQLGRYQKGLVELQPIYDYNLDHARRSVEHAAARGLLAYRLSSDIFPLFDYAEDARRLVPSFARARQIFEALDVHVSNHPSQFVVLSAHDEKIVQSSLAVLDDVGWTMESLGAEGSITLHGGGVYGDRKAAGARFHATLPRLTPTARRLLALENDEKSWTVPDLLDATKGEVPIVFDNLHWSANPRSVTYDEELDAALARWPAHRLPELHYSEQAEGKPRGAHADYITGEKLLEFLGDLGERRRGKDAVIIVEAKKKELAIGRAVHELRPRERERLFSLVPALATAPKEWLREAARRAGEVAKSA